MAEASLPSHKTSHLDAGFLRSVPTQGSPRRSCSSLAIGPDGQVFLLRLRRVRVLRDGAESHHGQESTRSSCHQEEQQGLYRKWGHREGLGPVSPQLGSPEWSPYPSLETDSLTVSSGWSPSL